MLNQVSYKNIQYFFDRRRGKVILREWLNREEKTNIKIIQSRLERISNGNYGDYKSVGNNILEIQTGIQNILYRDKQYYFLLFCGGDKSSQKKDIEKAKEYKVILDEKGLEYCVEKTINNIYTSL